MHVSITIKFYYKEILKIIIKDVEKYNEQIKKISSFNQLFYTPFPYITGKKKVIPFSKLPKELKEDYLEVVYFEKTA
ncbi:unnamed protein product, partial [marine sediment metagenome]